MRDYIEERNFREKIKSSIIKRMNVHYMTKEEIAQKKQEEEANERKAREMYENMLQQAREEEERQKEKYKKEMDKPEVQDASTYGTNREMLKEVTKEQIDAILAEKEETLTEIIEYTKHESEGK